VSDDDPVPSAPVSWEERLQLLTQSSLPPPLPSVGRLAAGAVALVAVVVAAYLLVLRSPGGPPPEVSMAVAGGAEDPAATTTSSVPSELVAHAAGAVVAPGIYRLPGGARVADLVEAAGGPLAGADLDQVNLAAAVVDGERVYVPVEGEVVTSVAAAPTAGPLDLNAADAEQLDALPGVGPATAAAILDERDRRGRFGSVEELLEVRGIGPAKLEQLRELVRV
jgi:competence protein ComEA